MTIAESISSRPDAKRRGGGSLAALLAAIVVALYAWGSWSNQFVYDDHEVIENQFPIRSWHDVASIFREPHYLNFPYYRPITRLTFALQQTIWGNAPRPYHLFNAALAGAVMLSAYALLRRSALGVGPIGATLAAGWFVLHPAFSECVYPAASGRETLLPMLMILLAVWAYLGRGRIWHWGAMLLFVAALLCKEQAAVLPGIFVLADVLGLTGRRWRTAAERAMGYGPMIGIFAGYFLVRHLIFRGSGLQWEIGQHPLDPLKSLLYGVQTGVMPFMELSYEPTFAGWFDWRLSAAALLAVGALIVLAARSEPSVRMAGIFWAGWFVLLQLPTAHLVRQEAGYSERYAALAILALPATAAAVMGHWRAGPRRIAGAIGLMWAGLLGTIGIFRGSYYTDDTTFCIRWVATDPDSPGPHNGLGRIAQEQHHWGTAIDEYRKSLQIEPDNATARNNLANVLAEEGDFDGAAEEYEWLLHNAGAGADPAATMTNYGQMLAMEAWPTHDRGLIERAHNLLIEAIAIRPEYAQAHYILGEWHVAFGSKREAMRQWEIALHLHPNWPEVREKLEKLEGASRGKVER